MVSPLKDITKKKSKKNIGVDAKYTEIKNAFNENDGVSSNSPNDSNNSLYVHLKNVIEKIDNTDDEVSCMSNIPSTFCSEASGSYIQVTLKKHHGKKETRDVPEQTVSHSREVNHPNTIAIQTSPLRFPSNNDAMNQIMTANGTAGEGDTSKNVNIHGNLDVGKTDFYVLSQPIVLAPYSHLAHNLPKTYVNTGTSPEHSSAFKKNLKKSAVLKRQSEEKVQTMANSSSFKHNSDLKCSSENKENYKSMCWIKTKLSKLSAPSPNADPERIDIYYFDHGNCNYFETTDLPPITISDYYADKTEHVATRFWAEVFGIPYLVLTFCTTFLLQFERFLLQGILRPLIVGFIQMLSDYLVKPLLAVTFNAIIQPPLIFVNNITSSFRDAFKPISQCIGYFVKECSKPIKSFRLVEINNKNNRNHKHTV